MKRIGVMVMVAACGSSSTKTPDARVADAQPDAAKPDAFVPDAYLPDSPEPVSGHYHYVISRQVWPTNANEARAEGFDLDNNGQVDNQLGQTMASLVSQGFDVQTPTDAAFAHGTPILLADLGADDLTTSASATFTIYQGTNPNPPACNGSADTTCGHHLHGSATFTAAATPRDTPLAGAIASGQLTAGPGHLTITISAFGSMPLTLLGARAKLTPAANGFMTGVIGGAISTTDRDTKIYPGLADALNAQIAHDCNALTSPPQCGCASGSTGATDVQLFDTTADCNITVTEIKNNSLIGALFAPDVTVENQSAISVGFAVNAVDATFTP